jgi:hypothetical protein
VVKTASVLAASFMYHHIRRRIHPELDACRLMGIASCMFEKNRSSTFCELSFTMPGMNRIGFLNGFRSPFFLTDSRPFQNKFFPWHTLAHSGLSRFWGRVLTLLSVQDLLPAQSLEVDLLQYPIPLILFLFLSYPCPLLL